MWFTRDAMGCRCWFVVESNGELRTGLVGGDFTTTIVNPDDTASSSPAVSESVQKPGVYRMDVPSAFLITHGVGHYTIVVEVNTVAGGSGPPEIVAVLGNSLQVSQSDFDSIFAPVEELYQLAGLDPTKPLVVTETTRKVPANGSDISQTIVESGGSVTVTRQ